MNPWRVHRATRRRLVGGAMPGLQRGDAVSLDDLNMLTDARIEIETLVLRRAVSSGDIQWEAVVVAAHHHLAGTPAVGSDGQANPEWLTVHERFDLALLEGCGNARLLAAALALRDAATLYRRWSLPVGHDFDRDVAGEHHRRAGRVWSSTTAWSSRSRVARSSGPTPQRRSVPAVRQSWESWS
ncbi:FCD domain-containing protein [Streptomyces sp. NPDC001984]|uniref:FCD domain-containing protein n=1 Tax=Streptomyces sp. NPDC002619 TaxID=3364655 RepID=UPI00367E0892